MATCDLSIVLVNYNTAHLLPEVMASIDAARGALDVQVIVVDNASRDGSVELLAARYPQVQVVANTVNVGFGRANNQALSLLRSDFVLLLNTDAFLSENSLRVSLDFMRRHPRCGILGARLVGRDGVLQPSCRYFPTPVNMFFASIGLSPRLGGIRPIDDMAWDHASARACDWVPGCFYLVRRQVIDEVGLFDDRFFLYFEEVDHCRTAKQAGWEVMYCPDTTVVHIGGESAKSEGKLSDGGRQLPVLQIESEVLYFRKHFGLRGLLLSAGLWVACELLLATKAMLKSGDVRRAAQRLSNLPRRFASLRQTAFGSRATR